MLTEKEYRKLRRELSKLDDNEEFEFHEVMSIIMRFSDLHGDEEEYEGTCGRKPDLMEITRLLTTLTVSFDKFSTALLHRMEVAKDTLAPTIAEALLVARADLIDKGKQ